jgi:heme exporter protein A
LALSGNNFLGNTEVNIARALHQIELHNYRDIRVQHLSAGLARRAALARLLVLRVPLWILDEPFTALDKEGIICMTAILQEHLQQGGMIIVTSHQSLAIDHFNVHYLSL